MSNKIKTLKNNSTYFDKLVKAKNVEGFYQIVGILQNPDPVLRKTGRGIEILKTLEREGQVATCITSRKSGVQSKRWQIQCSNDERKDFYVNLLKRLNLHNLIGNILNAPAYGFQPLEIIYKKEGEFILPDKITAPPINWFHFNNENELCFKMKGRTNGLVLDLSDMKFLCPINNPTLENPYGQGYLSLCFWDIAFKKGGYEFWAKFMEKYSMPYYVGKYDESASDSQINELSEALHNMVSDAIIVIPNNSTVDIIEAAGKSASYEIYEKFIKLCDANIAKNILGQTLTTDTGERGSYSLGKVHADVREDIIEADKRLVENTINELLSYIHALNFSDNDTPCFGFLEETGVKLELTNRDMNLKNIGVNFTKQYIKNTYNLEDDDFELSETFNNFADSTKLMRVSQSEGRGNESLTVTERGKRMGDTREALLNNTTLNLSGQKKSSVDDFSYYVSENHTDNVMNSDIKPVIEYIAKTNDTEGALEQLAEIYPKLNFKELEEILTKTIFLSELLGRNEVKNERE